MLQEAWRLKLKINRNLIDLSDLLLMKILSWRMKVCRRIGEIKKKKNMPICVPEREAELIKNKQDLAVNYGLAGDSVVELFRIIIRESKRIQSEIRRK